MEQYHGTNLTTASELANSRINVAVGGGELGKGFYTGDLLHEAFAWAWHKYSRNRAVLRIQIEDVDFLNLQPLCPNRQTTIRMRNLIKVSGRTRTYLFNQNAIWAPVVGKLIYDFNQIKFESIISESLLNSNSVIKNIY